MHIGNLYDLTRKPTPHACVVFSFFAVFGGVDGNLYGLTRKVHYGPTA